MSTIKVNAIQNTSGVEVYTAKAWVNFNGTGTVAIRASGNVSSITDNGVGSYTVNFTSAMPDINFATNGNCLGTSGATLQIGSTSSSTVQKDILTRVGVTSADVAEVNVAIFR